MSAVLTSSSVERVREALSRAGLADTIVELPGAARTARAAVNYLGRVDVARLAARVGEPVGKAGAEFVRRYTGFAIGGVPPAGHGLARAFVEKSLAAYPELWAAAGHPHTVFRLDYGALVRITGGEEVELA